MTATGNYSLLVSKIFGAGAATFPVVATKSNVVLEALNYTNQFQDFTANFTARLHRLKAIYSNHPAYMKELLIQVNEIASDKNWEGAFAELAAYDHLNQDILQHKRYLNTPIRPNVTLPNSDSFAAELGKQKTNLDGYVEDRPLYFDVKSFKDNVTEILEGIFRDFKKNLGITTGLTISAEHPLDISYDNYQSNRNLLFNELKNNVTLANQVSSFQSKVLSGLSYKLLWGAGALTTSGIYNPFLHASNTHKMIFNYANKFLKREPTVIILVSFPWYNGLITDFADANINFYRAFARRAFCQYRHSADKFKSFNHQFTGTQTIFQISNYLSGIIFLEDNTILSKAPNNTNVKTFVYLNPNATNALSETLAGEYVKGLADSGYDDFLCDNY